MIIGYIQILPPFEIIRELFSFFSFTMDILTTRRQSEV